MRFRQFLATPLRRLKSELAAFLSRRDPAEYFIALMLSGLSVFFVRCLVGGSESFVGIFFKGGNDLFMDYFNSLRDVAQGVGVYTERHVIYPPLANLLLLVIARVIPTAYLETGGFPMNLTWRAYPAAVLSVTFFFLVAMLLLFAVMQREQHHTVNKTLLLLLLLVSFPVLALIERGNIVILALIALLLFMQGYDSPRRAERELALFMLAVAAALKLYPALFGLLLLGERRYRELSRAALYTLALLLLPSFFFGGPICLWWVIENTLAYSRYTAGASALSGYPILLYLLYAAGLFLVTYAAFLQKKPWKLWLLISALLLSIPSIFSSYNWLLTLPALLAFLRTERLCGTNWIYFFLLTIPSFTYLPEALQGNTLVALIAGIFLISLLELFWLCPLFRHKRRRHEASHALSQMDE